jgi:serine/threonine-protein kinase
MSSPHPPRPGGRLGDYHLLHKIAQGGMGTVFLARRRGAGFEKTFAIKCMLDSLADDHEARAMFIDEARLAARLTHPNIAQIHDFGVIDDNYYIAMEHIPGEDLRTILARLRERKLRIPVAVAVRIMLDLCAGLGYAHNLSEAGVPLGIIHRDISPSNIMVSYQGAVKLLDFGIARASSRLSTTQSGALRGKLSYLSPEQINHAPLDARADVFTLGLTFYLLVTQQHPFRRPSGAATIYAITNDDLPDPRQFRPNLPAEVVDILTRALERDREHRFRSADEMGTALQAALARLAPQLGESGIASFMVALFGQQAKDDRISGPISGATLSVPPPDQPDGDTEIDSRGGGPTTLEVPMLKGIPLRRRSPPAALALCLLLSCAAMMFLLTAWTGSGPHDATASNHAPGVRGAPPAAGRTRTLAAPPHAAPDPLPATTAETPWMPRVPSPATLPLRPHSRSARRPAPRLDPRTLNAVVKAGHRRFEGCFRRHSADLPAPAGHVTVELSVASDGRVSGSRTLMREIVGSELAGCLMDETARLRFPRHPDREVSFRFPLTYREEP